MSDIDYAFESYKQANDYGRAIYESLFKLATIAFAFNGLLLTGLSFAAKNDVNAAFAKLLPLIIGGAAVFGFIFNVGAIVAFYAAWRAWKGVHKVAKDFEAKHEVMGQVQKNIVPERVFGRGVVFIFTLVFFTLWIVAWPILGLAYKHIAPPPGSSEKLANP